MKSTDVTIIAAPFGFGPTGKSLAISRELIKRGYSVKILGDKYTLKLVDNAGILAYEYKYRGELNLANLNSRVVISYLDISTKIINPSNIPLIFVDSLFWIRGWFEREYDYPAVMTLSQKFFKCSSPEEIKKTSEFHEVEAILPSDFLVELPKKRKKLVFYPGGLRSPYLGDKYGRAYFDWCLAVIKESVELAGWKYNDFVFILPPQLEEKRILKQLDNLGVKYLINCSNTANYFLSATHVFISPGIETTLESLASGVNPLFTPAFNGSHIPQLIADRMSNVGVELSKTFNSGLKQFESGTDHLSGLSMLVEEYTMSSLNNDVAFKEAVESMVQYLKTSHEVKNRFPLGKNGAKEICDYIKKFLDKECVKDSYYRVSVKARIKQNNKIVLVREDGKNWDLPGGGAEHNETIEEALKRELAEELGLTQFKISSSPRIFKMIDESANRPLLFIVFEFEIKSDVRLNPSKNVQIRLFEVGSIPDTVHYSDKYEDFIKYGDR